MLSRYSKTLDWLCEAGEPDKLVEMGWDGMRKTLEEDADGNWVLSSTKRQAQLNAAGPAAGKALWREGNGGDTTPNSR